MTVAESVLLDSVIFNQTQHNVGKVQDGRNGPRHMDTQTQHLFLN